jgi:hypothetical protein
MITLYAAGPMFGLRDASPFVTKADVLIGRQKETAGETPAVSKITL